MLLFVCGGCGQEVKPPDPEMSDSSIHSRSDPPEVLDSRPFKTERITEKAEMPSPRPLANSIKQSELKQVKQPESKPILPNTILIPSVNIKSRVDPVGVLRNGQMDVPRSPERVGVLRTVKPGQIGNAVIAGHVDNYTGPAVFYGLKKLKPGHPVIISNSAGNYLVFSVVSVEAYNTADAPIARIFGKTDEARLNLITCTGKFDRKKKEHLKRLIVFTRLMK
ncbi:class F sortase [Cohnella endophytica]|uniref:Class F sortase n=2 Tax=Cohnella endophytica TaxID=2419778 RepID=A0A494XX46_9BACL|nr:class F sortase [Cohnella endophytica]